MNRLEEHIKTRLQDREIVPSSEAWSKISRELKSEKRPSSNNKYWWAIAAGVIGVSVVSTAIFKSQSSLDVNENPIVVEDETVKEDKSNKREKTLQINNEESALPNNVLVVETVSNSDEQTEEKPYDSAQEYEDRFEDTTATTNTPLNDMENVTELAINSKLEEVMEQINVMEENAMAVTDAEIDSLLMMAQRELLTKKALQENGKVDAMALLNEVELELYDDQHNSLFIRLKESFFKLRTAVADRNN